MKFNIFGMKVRALKSHTLTQSTGWAGCYNSEKGLIVIDSELVGKEYQETLVHEFLEAVFDRCSFNQVIQKDQKEIMIDLLAKALVENFQLKVK